MFRYLGWIFALLTIAGSPLAVAQPSIKTEKKAADKKGADKKASELKAGEKVVLETWDIAYLGGNKAGYIHTLVRAFGKDEKKRFRTTTDLHLTIKRFANTIQLQMLTGTEEDEEGNVSAVSMKQMLGKGQFLVLNGKVEDKRLHVLVDDVRNGESNRRIDKTSPWNDKVIGLYRQERLLREKKVKPGDEFDYLGYEPTINYVVKMHVTVKEAEEVDVRGTKKKLLRIEAAAEKIKAANATVELPPLVAWVDAKYVQHRSTMEIPGLGQIVLIRGTEKEALGAGGEVASVQDIGLSQLVKLNRRIARPYDVESAAYRITLKGNKEPSKAFTEDDRQKIKNVKGDSFELHIKAAHRPKVVEKPEKVGEEFLKACFFLDCNDVKVKQHAAAAVGEETDPWRKALRIERWVHENMVNKNFTEAFATATQVARTREGDCTEHAVLAAAMARAAGIPSRTAFGLVYVDQNGQGPCMGFHMWAEVWVKGQWMPIDATLGRGFVGATHIKIADNSWHDTQTLTPLLPIAGVVGKVKIEVLRVGAAE